MRMLLGSHTTPGPFHRLERKGRCANRSMRSVLDEIAREGARRLLLAALETEVAAYLEAHAADRDGDGHALVVRNGKGRTRRVTVGSGTIAVNAPRVNDRRLDAEGQRCKFTSRILPPY